PSCRMAIPGDEIVNRLRSIPDLILPNKLGAPSVMPFISFHLATSVCLGRDCVANEPIRRAFGPTETPGRSVDTTQPSARDHIRDLGSDPEESPPTGWGLTRMAPRDARGHGRRGATRPLA